MIDFFHCKCKDNILYGKTFKRVLRLTDGKYSLRKNKPDGFYPIYVSQDLNKFSLTKKADYLEALPITDKGVERVWKTSGKTFMKKVKEGKIVAKIQNSKIILLEKLFASQIFTTHWMKKKYHAYHFGTKLLETTLGRKAFSFPKSLYTVLDTIKIMSAKNDIILDFHAGSGTTGHAVLELNKEDNGYRQFILVEQLNEHIDICNERNQKVLKENNIDDNFTYFELKKYNQIFIDEIEEAKYSLVLFEIWEQMKSKSFLNYNVDIKKQEAHIEDFKRLKLKEQKEHLIELLDKNQLYVNISSINDDDFLLSEEEKQVSEDFYQINRD